MCPGNACGQVIQVPQPRWKPGEPESPPVPPAPHPAFGAAQAVAAEPVPSFPGVVRTVPGPAIQPPTAPSPPATEHSLRIFSAGLTMFLGLITINIFAVARMLWLHGCFPQRRPSDPTATQAILLAFIPFYNLYWGPFALARLVTRLNEQRRELGLPELRLHGLVAAFTVCMLIGVVGGLPLQLLLDDPQIAGLLLIAGPLFNLFLVVPLLTTSIQNGANAVVDASQLPAAASRAAQLVQIELKWRARQRITWGSYLCSIAALHFFAISAALALSPPAEDRLQVALANFFFVTAPLLITAAVLFVRARSMGLRRARLERAPEQAGAICAAERRTSRWHQLAGAAVIGCGGLAIPVAAAAFEFGRSGVSYYGFLDEVLPHLLVITIPAWLIAMHLLARALERENRKAAAGSPILNLELRPTPWWPTAASAAAVAAILVVTVCWDRYERYAVNYAEASAAERQNRELDAYFRERYHEVDPAEALPLMTQGRIGEEREAETEFAVPTTESIAPSLGVLAEEVAEVGGWRFERVSLGPHVGAYEDAAIEIDNGAFKSPFQIHPKAGNRLAVFQCELKAMTEDPRALDTFSTRRTAIFGAVGDETFRFLSGDGSLPTESRSTLTGKYRVLDMEQLALVDAAGTAHKPRWCIAPEAEFTFIFTQGADYDLLEKWVSRNADLLPVSGQIAVRTNTCLGLKTNGLFLGLFEVGRPATVSLLYELPLAARVSEFRLAVANENPIAVKWAE